MNISKAYPVIKDVVAAVDNHIGYMNVKSTHKSRSDEGDLGEILNMLKKLRPFSFKSGRTHNDYKRCVL